MAAKNALPFEMPGKPKNKGRQPGAVDEAKRATLLAMVETAKANKGKPVIVTTMKTGRPAQTGTNKDGPAIVRVLDKDGEPRSASCASQYVKLLVDGWTTETGEVIIPSGAISGHQNIEDGIVIWL